MECHGGIAVKIGWCRYRDGVRVSVLGYHDFSNHTPETEMLISTAKFRKQMEALRQLGISVISMADFIAWKAGEKQIPEKSVVITIDDGWKSTYTDAFPILRELGYPFTIYLYKNYVDGGGRALTTPMIREMIKAGVDIGSHSVSHPYPITFKKYRKQGPEAYESFLTREMDSSKTFLENRFNIKTPTYSYPGGYFTTEMLPVAEKAGYTHLFTVQPGKVKLATPNTLLPRYMILGNYDRIFEYATTFRNSANPIIAPEGAIAGMIQSPDQPVSPEPGVIINSRLPVISADLSSVENLDPQTITMKIGGFGTVPANYDPATGILSWQVNRRLRHPTCQVSVNWRDSDGNPPEKPLRWSFSIDLESAYLPDGE